MDGSITWMATSHGWQYHMDDANTQLRAHNMHASLYVSPLKLPACVMEWLVFAGDPNLL